MGRESRDNLRSFSARHLPPIARDALGRVVGPGDLVLLQPQSGHILWQIAEVAPEIDPRYGNNVVRVTLTCTMPFHALTGQPGNFLMVVPQADVPAPGENAEAPSNGGPKIQITDVPEEERSER